jgi:hypothetical protein
MDCWLHGLLVAAISGTGAGYAGASTKINAHQALYRGVEPAAA